MKKYLVTSVLLTCLISVTTNCYAQTHVWNDIKSDSIIVRNESVFYKKYYGIFPTLVCYDSIRNRLFYIVKLDSSKYYYKRYLALKHKGVPDSINHWYWMLQKLKK